MKIHILICLSLIYTFSAQLSANNTRQPNIILILVDDLGYGDVGFNGQTIIKTPHLDQMAKDGVLMTQFYAGSSVCGPSRATLLFGQHTGHAPIRGNPLWTFDGKKSELKKDDILLPMEMKRLGYNTAHFGKWGMNENLESELGHPLDHGFDEFVGFNTHVEAHFHWPDYVWEGRHKKSLGNGKMNGRYAHKITYANDYFQEKALDYIDRQSQNTKPFFMYLCYTIPHKGHTAPEESKQVYKGLGQGKYKGDNTKHYEMDDNMAAAYAGMISRMDGYVGSIRSKLAEIKLDQNTLIFFTSDNGHEWWDNFFKSSGPFKGKKRDLTEGGIRVPTVAVWPGHIPQNQKISSPFAFWDILPTFCDVGGGSTLAKTDGLSFLPFLKGQLSHNDLEDRVFYWEFNEKRGPCQALRIGDWKSIRSWNFKKNDFGSLKLYNTSVDPYEDQDVSSQYPEICSRMIQELRQQRTFNKQFLLKPHPKLRKK